jgi:hypothetical protein
MLAHEIWVHWQTPPTQLLLPPPQWLFCVQATQAASASQ